MGLNILIFSFTSPVLFKALPYPEPHRLVDVSLTPPLYFILRDRTSAAFDALGVFDAGRSANLSGDSVGQALRLGSGQAERLNGHRITATGLAALGATPLLGRLPVAADERAGATPTMLLSYEVWQRRFAGRADVVGQTVMVDGQPTQILGVMPEGFGLLDNSSDAWFTFGFEPSPAQQTPRSLRGVGRLKPGVSLAQAQAAVKLALDEHALLVPDRDKGWTVELLPWREARFGALRQPLLMLQLAVGGMLLVLCVNVARGLVRRSRERSERVAKAEVRNAAVLSFGGGAIGAVLAALALPALRDLAPRALPRLDEVAFDAHVLAFSAVLCVVTGLVIWIAALPHSALRHSRTPALSHSALVVFVALQMALAFVLLAGAGLASRAVLDLRGRDVGIDPSGLLSLDVHLPRDPYVTLDIATGAQAGSLELAEYHPAGADLYDRIRAALQMMPGVVQAAGVGTPPFAAAPFVQFWIDDQEHAPENQNAAQYLAVTENYFNTMGIRILRGRDFSPADRRESPWVILVNEAMARQHFPDGDPIGRRLTLTSHPNDGEAPREIVGLVTDTLPFRGASEVPPLIFLLHRQQAARQRASFEPRRTVMSFIVRAAGDAGDPLALGGGVRSVVSQVDVTTPVTSIRTVESYLDAGQVMLLKFAATLLGVFALVALVTGAVGMYGLTSYGAVAAAVIGAAVGLLAWRRLGSVIEPFLTNLTVTPSDPLPLVVTAGVLLVIAVVVSAFRRTGEC